MKQRDQTLTVRMNGSLVGVLEKTPSAGLKFNYDSSWLDLKNARPISLSLPLINRSFEGEVVTDFFDNLLPDNPKIRARIQSILHIATDHPLGMQDHANGFRISIAGAQEKSAFLYHNGQWNTPIGTTPTTHIFKLPIGYIAHQNLDLRDSCENEWLCSRITKAFGLPVASCEIQQFEDVKALVVERFDRALSSDQSWIMRLPQEDLYQALGVSSNLKYQADGGPGIKEVMNLLLGSMNAIEDRHLLFRSQVLFWILAAVDGHAKNFSLFILPQGKYRLTPLYDIISAYPMMKTLQPQKIKMAMSLKGKNNHYHWYNSQRRYFLQTAKHVNYSPENAAEILDEMLSKIDAIIETVSKELPKGFPESISQPIFDGMRAMKLVLIS